MSHSLTKIWIHGVFGTKDHAPMIRSEVECQLYAHIQQHLENDLECGVRIINGTEDHIHILFMLNPNIAASDVFKNIKGESSHWWNQRKLTKVGFAWQIGYGAFSVSESQVKRVEDYIRRQEEHHRKMTFQQEVELLMRKYNVALVENH